jgi:hypothetical protein
MIIMQLKSTQQEEAFDNITAIINKLHTSYNYRIRGHEVHQTRGVMTKTSLSERVKMVSRFCACNEIQYLAYHSPILGKCQNIWEERWQKKVKESITLTIQEAQAVEKEIGLDKVTIVFHMTNYMPFKQAPKTYQDKILLYQKAEDEFLKLFEELGVVVVDKDDDDNNNSNSGSSCCVLAVENTYPRYDRDSMSIGPFHPLEMRRMEKHGVKTTLDLAHYQLYSNYMRYGKGSTAGDLDRERYGEAPSWRQCIETLANSLVLIHISDATGLDAKGEGLPVGTGEIPIAEVLSLASRLPGKNVQGTIELSSGHLYKSQLQLESAKWLLENIPDAFKEAKGF